MLHIVNAQLCLEKMRFLGLNFIVVAAAMFSLEREGNLFDNNFLKKSNILYSSIAVKIFQRNDDK